MTSQGAKRTYIRSSTELGGAIQEARRSAGLTQAQLAEWIGTNRIYLSKIESGLATTQLTRVFDALDILGLQLSVAPRRNSPDR